MIRPTNPIQGGSSLKLRDTKRFPTCFAAFRRAHSEKPGEFYEMSHRATGEGRIDMFGRRSILGFESWGNEAPVFEEVPA